jgi:SMP-30/gluconolaconase/LRE-like protein
MSGFGAVLGRFFSRGDAGISVPAMDGVFRPNNRLETAERLLSLDKIDTLVGFKGDLVASAGDTLYRITLQAGEAARNELETFDAQVTFVAAADDGRLAAGLQGSGIRIGGPGNWTAFDLPQDQASCMTAAEFLPDGRLAICVGSRANSGQDWKRDLMELGHTGQVIVLDPEAGAVKIIADGLAYPNGISVLDNGRLAVSESWRHRILSVPVDGSGDTQVLLDDLPAYPSRLSREADGGVWMALFAPRRQLFELVLREDDYRREMIATIEPEEWIGPELGVSHGQVQPLQQGSVRQMGILKPWAPSRSYGLVVRCDGGMRPLESWHSRADGTMHGVTSVCATGDGVFAASQGAGTLLRLPAPSGQREAK